VEENQVVSLLGRNGAGKTTVIRSIMGLTPPRSGTILFRGEIISGLKPYQIFKGDKLFLKEGNTSLSVENLRWPWLRGLITPRQSLKSLFFSLS
jgi:branched-chain amino acid transport system ATP-binding protein